MFALSKIRCLALLSMFSLASATAAGCSSAETSDQGGSEQAVTDVKQSSIKDQSTDNCWIYATTGWVESLVKTAGGGEMNLSESYMTYWNWYDQIVAGEVTGDKVEEGGSWGQAGDQMLHYGVMHAKDFIPGDEQKPLSDRQATALTAVNEALKTGELKTAAQRNDRKHVREVLDKAWGLGDDVKGYLDTTFGADVSKTLNKNYRVAKIPDGVPITKASDLKAHLKNPTTKEFEEVSVDDAIGTHKTASDVDHRNGAFAWNDVAYPRTATARRKFLKRVQLALADGQPVVINWYVDFAALTDDGKFLGPPEKPGLQGGHVTILEDYQVENVPGFGTLPVGVLETRPEALAAALDDQATVTLFRIKNSWGPTYHTLAAPAPGGYHDLYLKYLNGPIQECDMDDKDNPKPDTCEKAVPFESVVLPAGY